MSTTLPIWVQHFFDGFYAQCDLRWPVEHQQYVANGLMRHLNLQAGAHVFDQCCGEGYLAHALSKKGCHVWGVDQSETYIQTARTLTPNGTFVAADAGIYTPDNTMDAAVNWHTSLGYGGKEGALLLLQRLTQCLKHGGLFIVDVRNVSLYKQQALVSHETIATKQWGDVLMTRSGEWKENVLWQNWSASTADGVVWSQEDAACFHPSLKDMDDLFEHIGAKRVHVLGTFDEAFDDQRHERMIVVGQKL